MARRSHRSQHLPELRRLEAPAPACGNCGWYAGRQAIEVD